MSERSGLHGLLGNSRVYAFVQNGLVRMATWDRVQQQFLAELRTPGTRVIDIGCGPAKFLSNYPWFPQEHYTGFDPSDAYIQTARVNYPAASLHVGTTASIGDAVDGTFDVAMAFGVLHHVTDDEAIDIARFARRHLRPGGLFLTMDPVLIPRQNPIARVLAKADRGKHVREMQGYLRAVATAFGADSVESQVMSGLLRVPYNHAILVATNT